MISVGTGICGGSAIAAIAPVIRAKPNDVSVSLAVVFSLNAIALFIFPPIGHFFHLSQNQFGLWSAFAIHDTSSVIGAAMQYGNQALEVATPLKLARALWIIPTTLTIAALYSRKNYSRITGKSKMPWFILGFLAAATLMTYYPNFQSTGHTLNELSKRLLVFTLFLIGTNLTKENLKEVGAKPLIQGLVVWLLLAASSLGSSSKIGATSSTG